MNQNGKLIEHMLSGKSITRLEALYLYKIQNITARIRDIREEHMVDVETTIKTDETGAEYASYSIPEHEHIWAKAELRIIKRNALKRIAA